MKRRLIEFICVSIKYMPQLLSHKKVYKYNNDVSDINVKNISDEIVVDFKETDNRKCLKSDKETAIENIIAGCGLLKDYEFINAYKVNKENILDINGFLKERKSLKRDDIKKEANGVATTLIRINEGNGTIYNYKKFNIDVIQSELNIINKFIGRHRLECGKDLTISEIQNTVAEIIVNIDKSIIKINDGRGKKNDYQAIGIDNMNEENIDGINVFLKNKNINTPNKIRSEIKRYLNALSKVAHGIGTINNYNTIGLDIDGKRIRIINTVLKNLYEKQHKELSVDEIMEINNNIIDSHFKINSVNKAKEKLIICGN